MTFILNDETAAWETVRLWIWRISRIIIGALQAMDFQIAIQILLERRKAITKASTVAKIFDSHLSTTKQRLMLINAEWLRQLLRRRQGRSNQPQNKKPSTEHFDFVWLDVVMRKCSWLKQSGLPLDISKSINHLWFYLSLPAVTVYLNETKYCLYIMKRHPSFCWVRTGDEKMQLAQSFIAFCLCFWRNYFAVAAHAFYFIGYEWRNKGQEIRGM